MDWVSLYKNNEKWIVGLVITICVLLIVLSSYYPATSYDSFWHIQTGKDWIENGLSPFIDHYSFTFNGAPIIAQPIFFQVLIYGITDLLGYSDGVFALVLISQLIVFVLFVAYMRQAGTPWPVGLVLLSVLVFLLALRSMARPELINYSFMVVAMMIYRWDGGELSPRKMTAMLLLMLAWTNYHTPIFGYVIFFGLFVDGAVKRLRDMSSISSWMTLFAWGIAILVVGGLNVGFEHPLWGSLQFSDEWRVLIQEYKSSAMYTQTHGIFFAGLVAVISVILAIRQKKFGYLVILGLLIWKSLLMARLVTPSGIVILCIAAHLTSKVSWYDESREFSPRANMVIGLLLTMITAISLYSGFGAAMDMKASYPKSFGKLPWATTDYLSGNNGDSRIFNEYRLGGFLINHLPRNQQVYIDGRTGVLYPIDHMKLSEKLKTSPKALGKEIVQYDMTHALVDNIYNREATILETGRMGLDFIDEAFLLYAVKNPSLGAIGLIHYQPACWNNSIAGQIETEMDGPGRSLSQNNGFNSFISFLAAYVDSSDKPGFLRAYNQPLEGDTTSINREYSVYRFAGFRALEHGENELAVRYFRLIQSPQVKDLFAAAWAEWRLGNKNEAERIMFTATNAKWKWLDDLDVLLQYNLVKKLQPLKIMDPTLPDWLKKQLEEADLTPLEEISLDDFCSPTAYAGSIHIH